jgi:predicted nucleotidyltransferase
MTFYEEVFKDLDSNNIRYLLVGGVAVNLHGFVRMTADLDLVVALDPDNLAAFITLMKSRGYKPRVPVPIEDFADPEKRKRWVKDKGMKVFSLYHPQKLDELIDIFVEEPLPFSDAYARKKIAHLGITRVNIMSIPDLIVLKKKAGRPQDMQDIAAMEDYLRTHKP